MRFYLLEKDSRHTVDECIARTLSKACAVLFGRNPRLRFDAMVVDDIHLDEAQVTRHYPSLKSYGK